MIVKVKTHGHQFYSETIGKVIKWCSAVESYSGKHMEVPAVLMHISDSIVLVPLQKQYIWREVEVLPDTVSAESP